MRTSIAAFQSSSRQSLKETACLVQRRERRVLSFILRLIWHRYGALLDQRSRERKHSLHSWAGQERNFENFELRDSSAPST